MQTKRDQQLTIQKEIEILNHQQQMQKDKQTEQEKIHDMEVI